MVLARLTALATLLYCGFGCSAVLAQYPIVRIEEDWELLVTQPDEQLDAPQITTTMMPFGEDSDLLLQVDLNHASTPSFSKGGFQVRVCVDEHCLADLRRLEEQRFEHQSELVSWTQVVQLAGDGFYFGIGAGSSLTWGSFGGEDAFVFVSQAEAGSESLSLNAYTPQASLNNSATTYAANRVGHLRLKKIRVINSAGQVSEWTVNEDVQ